MGAKVLAQLYDVAALVTCREIRTRKQCSGVDLLCLLVDWLVGVSVVQANCWDAH